MSVLKAGVYFLKASMEADLAKEVGDGVSGVKRAAEWDPGLRYAKMARQVCYLILRLSICGSCMEFLMVDFCIGCCVWRGGCWCDL